MYNKFNKEISVVLREQIKNIAPVKDIAIIPENSKLDGETTGVKQVEVTVHQKKYAKAKRQNPNPDQLYIKQINSYGELFE